MRKRVHFRRVVAVAAAFVTVGGIAVAVNQGMSSGASSNLIDHSGFRYGADGWKIESTGSVNVQRTSPGALGSHYALRLGATSAIDVHLEDERQNLPKTKKGESYLGVVFLRTTGASVTGALGIRELNGSKVVGSGSQPFTVSGSSWKRVPLTYNAKAAGNDLLVSVDFSRVPAKSAVILDALRLMVEKPGSSNPNPSPSPTPTNPPPSDPPGGGRGDSKTLFGASVYQAGRTWDAAVSASDSRYSKLDVVRVFYPGLPSAWPGRAGSVNRPVVVSFKGQPSQILSGQHDAQLLRWFKEAPRDRDIWWTYWHEPEDNVAQGDFTSKQFRDAYRRVAGLAKQASNPKLHNSVILMCWSANPNSGRSVPDFFPGRDIVETIGWDCYNKSDSYLDPQTMFAKAISATRSLGVDFGIAELGSKLRGGDGGSGRAQWLRKVADHLSNQGAQFVTYFDSLVPGGEFRLLDSPSQQAWREVVAR